MTKILRQSDLNCLQSSEEIVIVGKKSIFLKKKVLSFLLSITSNEDIERALAEDDVIVFWSKTIKFYLIVLPDKTSHYNSSISSPALTKKIHDLRIIKEKIGIIFLDTSDDDILPFLSAIVRSFPIFSKRKNTPNQTIEVCLLNHQLESTRIPFFDILTKGLQSACLLIDMPPDQVTPDYFETIARKVAAETNSEISIISGEDLKDGGFGGLYNVGRGSPYSPRLIVLSKIKNLESETIALVGKGITYDSGGLSLKGWHDMQGMKSDMAGAAVVLEAFRATALIGSPHNIHAILCVAENMISSSSLKPDEIVQLFSGKTVEIVNSDSEGRLILADGVSFAELELKASKIINLGTLTTSQVLATGNVFSAIVSNDIELEKMAIVAGKKSGDLVHPLPFCPEVFFTEFESGIADMTNSIENRNTARTTCAAHFIASHLQLDGIKWLHCDMLAPSRVNKRATGFGFFFLIELLSNLGQDS